jgi:hypothetical protein
MPRRSTGKPSVTREEAVELRANHVAVSMTTLTDSEMRVLRRLHVIRVKVPRAEARQLRTDHLSKVEPSVIYRLQLCRDYTALMERDCAYYGVDEIPERVILKLDKVLGEKDDTKAREFAHRAWKSMEMFCLAAWARGRAPGPPTRENIERRARNAESLAKMLEAKDQPIAAAKQRQRAVGLRSQLTHL